MKRIYDKIPKKYLWVGLFGLIAATIITLSLASGPFVSIEAENAIIRKVTVKSDPDASNGQYVQFADNNDQDSITWKWGTNPKLAEYEVPMSPDDVGPAAFGLSEGDLLNVGTIRFYSDRVATSSGSPTVTGTGTINDPWVISEVLGSYAVVEDDGVYARIERSIIRPSTTNANAAQNNHGDASTLMIYDTEIGRTSETNKTSAVGTQGRFVIVRSYLHNSPDGVKVNYPAEIIQSYIRPHEKGTKHTDGMQATGPNDGDYIIGWNNVRANNGLSQSDASGNAALYIQNNPQSATDNAAGIWKIVGNRFIAGGYSIRLYGADTATYTVEVRDNTFVQPWQFGSHHITRGSAVTWSNNVDENGNIINR